MSLGKRAYNVMRAYVGREWERIQNLERLDALEELDGPIGTNSDKVREEKVKRELEKLEDPIDSARKVLGVSELATFDEIRAKFKEMNESVDPSEFPAGSAERREAESLLKRVHWAYQMLTREIPATEKRFRSLEID